MLCRKSSRPASVTTTRPRGYSLRNGAAFAPHDNRLMTCLLVVRRWQELGRQRKIPLYVCSGIEIRAAPSFFSSKSGLGRSTESSKEIASGSKSRCAPIVAYILCTWSSKHRGITCPDAKHRLGIKKPDFHAPWQYVRFWSSRHGGPFAGFSEPIVARVPNTTGAVAAAVSNSAVAHHRNYRPPQVAAGIRNIVAWPYIQ